MTLKPLLIDSRLALKSILKNHRASSEAFFWSRSLRLRLSRQTSGNGYFVVLDQKTRKCQHMGHDLFIRFNFDLE